MTLGIESSAFDFLAQFAEDCLFIQWSQSFNERAALLAAAGRNRHRRRSPAEAAILKLQLSFDSQLSTGFENPPEMYALNLCFHHPPDRTRFTQGRSSGARPTGSPPDRASRSQKERVE